MIIDPSKNSIICGDNIEWLKWLPDNSVDLCYIDPPFFSNRNYEIIWGNGYEVRSFGDRFAGGVNHYIDWMRPRIALIHSKLKQNGTLYLHCDWHASHRLRCLLDEIFGESNFRDEIVWYYSNKYTGNKKDGLVKQHDLIFRYSKSADFKFNILRTPSKHAGRTTSTTERARVNGKSIKVMKRHDDGNLVHQIVGSEKNLGTVFEIDFINSQAKERLGYPTQKPEKLIKQLILGASDQGDLVLDCFAGGGTTAKVAIQNERRFVVGDVSPVAVKIMSHRLNIECSNLSYDVFNLPRTVDEFQQIDGHKFAELVCDLMGWKVNPKKSNDGGIDGFDGEGNPIQVKNHTNTGAGRPEIQKFHSAIIKQKKKKGIFVAWQFARTALEYIAEVKSEHGIEIIAKRCDEVFGDLVIPHEKAENIKKFFAERFPEVWKNRTDRIDEISAAEQMNQAVEQRLLEEQHKKVLKKIKNAKDKIKLGDKPKKKSGT